MDGRSPFAGPLYHLPTTAWGVLIVFTNDNRDYDIQLDIVREANRRSS